MGPFRDHQRNVDGDSLVDTTMGHICCGYRIVQLQRSTLPFFFLLNHQKAHLGGKSRSGPIRKRLRLSRVSLCDPLQVQRHGRGELDDKLASCTNYVYVHCGGFLGDFFPPKHVLIINKKLVSFFSKRGNNRR